MFELIELSIKLTIYACIAAGYLMWWMLKLTIVFAAAVAAAIVWCVNELTESRRAPV
jgi:hypothetical protein